MARGLRLGDGPAARPTLSIRRPERAAILCVRETIERGTGSMAQESNVQQQSVGVAAEPRRIHYPESDGVPMSENDFQAAAIFSFRSALVTRFAHRSDVYVAGNLFVYYEEGNPARSVSPDLFVVFGVANRLRRTYRIWDEGKAPDFVLEVVSPSSGRRDLVEKRRLYRALGVSEYFVYDPGGTEGGSNLTGFRRWGRRYVRLRADAGAESGGEMLSEVLGMRLRPEGVRLRLVDPRTGRAVPIPPESAGLVRRAEERAREAEERAREEATMRRTAEGRAREAEERARAVRLEREEAKARIAELEATLAAASSANRDG